MAGTPVGDLRGAPSGRIRVRIQRRTARIEQPLDLRTPSGRRTLPY